MHVLLFVLLFGTALNTLNDHPKNFNGVKASLEKQLHAPVAAADYSKLNK